jgi:toxin ParE1/3/4
MPRVVISFAASAVRDLEEIKGWYAGQGVSDIGEPFAAEVFQRVETLVDHPDNGRVWWSSESLLPFLHGN